MSKIVDESILVFSRVSLSKFSLKRSTFCGYNGIYSNVCEECERSFFYKTGHSSDLASRLIPITSSSRKIIDWPECHFCPVVL